VLTADVDSMAIYEGVAYGLANLKGKSVAERAKAVIALAHPDYREGLEREARDNRLIPKGFV
jgi:acyl-CoA hydrolase